MSRYGGNRNPFDDDDEAGGFGGGSSSSSRSGGGYRGGSYQQRGRVEDDGYGGSSRQQRGRVEDDGYGGSSRQQRGRVEDDGYGGSSRSGYSRGYGGGSGLDYDRGSKGSVGLGREGQSSSYQYGRGGGYNDSGYGHGYSDDPPPMTDAEFQTRKQEAIRKMEDSSFNSLRTLHDCVRMGTETTEELERQAEALDRVETRLDEIHVGLDKGERNLRKIRSPFGGVMNYFSKKKSVNEVTDPKGYKPSQQQQSNSKKSGNTGGGKQQAQAQLPQQTHKSTGSNVVDKNLDLMGKALDDLMGIGELIGEQLDDSDCQVDRIAYKMDRDQLKMEKLNKGIKKELYK